MLREFAKAARGAEVTLFFYAGHGLQVEGENYLVPVDARLADEVDLDLEAFELAKFMRRMRGGTNLVFLDACRDNPLASNLVRSMGPTRSAAVGRGLGRVETGSGTLIAYATQPGNVADDGEGRNSPFTGALLAHIATPGLSVDALLARVTDDVMKGTGERQQPWRHSSLRKPFYFVPPSGNAVRNAARPWAGRRQGRCRDCGRGRRRVGGGRAAREGAAHGDGAQVLGVGRGQRESGEVSGVSGEVR